MLNVVPIGLEPTVPITISDKISTEVMAEVTLLLARKMPSVMRKRVNAPVNPISRRVTTDILAAVRSFPFQGRWQFSESF